MDFMTFSKALSSYTTDRQLRLVLNQALDHMRPPEAVEALIDAISLIAPMEMTPQPWDDMWTTLDEKQWNTPCPFYVPMMHTVTGEYRAFFNPCGKSFCTRCGMERTAGILDALRKNFEPCNTVWITVLDSVDTKLRDRLSTRARSRAASYAWVRRFNGAEVWFASKTLGASSPPYLFSPLQPHQAFLLARAALLIPYWETARASKEWQWPTFWHVKTSSGEWQKIREACGKDMIQRAEKLLKIKIVQRVGYYADRVPTYPPAEISVAEWKRVLQESFEEAQTKSI